MPRQAKPRDNTLLEMAIVGYQSELGRISAKIPKGRIGPIQSQVITDWGGWGDWTVRFSAACWRFFAIPHPLL